MGTVGLGEDDGFGNSRLSRSWLPAEASSSGCPSPASRPSPASSISSTSLSAPATPSPGLPKGHVVAAEQIALPVAAPASPAAASALPPLSVEDGPRFVRIAGEGFALRFDRLTGALDSFVHGGRELLASGIEPNFWRAPTDNDFGNQMPRRLAFWRQASLYRDLESLEARETGPAA